MSFQPSDSVRSTATDPSGTVVSTGSPLFEQLAEEYERVLARTDDHATVYADVESDAVHHVDPHEDEQGTG